MANNTVELSIIAIDSASNIIENIGAKFGILGELGAAAMAAIAAAGVFAVKELGSLSEEGAKAEDVQAMFNSVISTSPLLDYKNQLLDLAAAYSKTTRFEDENIISAETVLLRYQNLSKDVMPLAIKTTLNLATVMGTDATSAAQQLGKGLEDIAGGSLSLLARTRLLTAEQKDAAVAMAKGGDAAGAQAFVLDILDKKIGTLAEDMGQTFAGKAKILQDAISNLREEMGIKLNDALKPLLDTFQAIFDKYAPMISQAFDTYVLPAIIRAVEGVKGLIDIFGTLFDDLISGIQTGNFDKFWTDLKESADKGLKKLGEITSSLDTIVGNWLTTLANKIKDWTNSGGPQKLADDMLGWITGVGDSPIFKSNAGIGASRVIISIGEAIKSANWGPIDLALGNMMQNAFNSMMDKFAGWAGEQMNKLLSSLATQANGSYSSATGSFLGVPTYRAPSSSGGQVLHRASGGWADGLTLVGEQGPELVNLPSGSYVNSNSKSAGMGGNFTFVYSPMFSMGNKQEAENVMAPIVANVVRRMQVDGRV